MQDTADRLANLRRQEREFQRHGYHAHNRQPQTVTMHQLVHRRRRRFWGRLLASWAADWQPTRFATV